MNEKNYDYLINQLKYTGFGEELQADLKAKIESAKPEFSIGLQKLYGKDEMNATLHFRKSNETDMYFFNRYEALLKNEKNPDGLRQTFYVNPKDAAITLKEAYNLLSGRSVHKELTSKDDQKYHAWLQVDFKETDTNGNHKMKSYHQNYGYDLKAVLNSYPIRELGNAEHQQRLTESLERGNRQVVTMDLGGKESKMFIEANPQFKTLNLYDADMKRVSRQSLNEENGASEKKEVKKSEKQNSDDEDGAPKNKKKKRQKIS